VGSFNVVGVASEAIVLEGPQSVPPTTLVSIELTLEPPLRLWAVATHTWAAGGGHRNQLAPFAVDEQAWQRWRLLVTDQAAARTQATLRQMGGGPRPH
jgi:hypothetical protein